MRQIAIVGHTGVVGTALLRLAMRNDLDIVTASRSPQASKQFDLATDEFSLDANVETVFLTAALTNVDYCEQHPDESRKTNLEGPLRIAKWCAGNGARFVFFSSDYVFDGVDGPYGEDSVPLPVNVYGRHKLEAEHAIADVLPDVHLIIRTTVVFGPEHARKNFAVRLVDQLRMGRSVSVPDDQIGTPTWSIDLAEHALELDERKSTGIVHVAGSSRVSRYDFALRAAEMFSLDASLISRCDTPSLHQPARRPMNAGLVSTRLRRRTCTMDEGLHAFAQEIG